MVKWKFLNCTIKWILKYAISIAPTLRSEKKNTSGAEVELENIYVAYLCGSVLTFNSTESL